MCKGLGEFQMRLRNSETYKAKKSNLNCTLEMAHSEDSVPKVNPYANPTSIFTKQNAGVHGVHDAIQDHHPERNRMRLFFCLIILTAPLTLLALASRNHHGEKAQAEAAKVTRDEGAGEQLKTELQNVEDTPELNAGGLGMTQCYLGRQVAMLP